MQVFPYHKQWPVCKKKKNMRKKVQENKVFSKEKFTIFFTIIILLYQFTNNPKNNYHAAFGNIHIPQSFFASKLQIYMKKENLKKIVLKQTQ